MHQYILNLVCLLDLDTDAYTVDAGLDQDLFILVSGHGQRVEEDFWGAGGFDLGDVMPLRSLGGEV